MCVVSMVMDHYYDKWRQLPTPPDPLAKPQPSIQEVFNTLLPKAKEPPITDEEIREFRALLQRAREYDKRNNEPDCEMESKKAAIRTIAKQLGVDVSFIDEQQEAE